MTSDTARARSPRGSRDDSTLRIEHMRRSRVDVDAHSVTYIKRAADVLARDELRPMRGAHVDQRFGTERFDQFDFGLQGSGPAGGERETFRPHAEVPAHRHRRG